MITNFEEITSELTEEELKLIPLLIAGFKMHSKENPIKAPEIVQRMRSRLENTSMGFSEPRLRKCVHHIRVNGLLPLIATSAGYYVSNDLNEIRAQVKSLMERSASIRRCAEGLSAFLPVHNL